MSICTLAPNPVLSLHSTWPSSTYASYNLSLHVYIIHCPLTSQQSFPILISPLFLPPVCSCFLPCILCPSIAASSNCCYSSFGAITSSPPPTPLLTLLQIPRPPHLASQLQCFQHHHLYQPVTAHSHYTYKNSIYYLFMVFHLTASMFVSNCGETNGWNLPTPKRFTLPAPPCFPPP